MRISKQQLDKIIKEEIQAVLGEKRKANPWAICTAKVGREDKAKYEKCVKSIKKGLREAAKDYVWGIKNPQRVVNKFSGWGSVKIKRARK